MAMLRDKLLYLLLCAVAWQFLKSRSPHWVSSSSEGDPFAVARHESLNFFTDIDEKEWGRLKEKVREVYPNVKGRNPKELEQHDIFASVFFQDHYEPDFSCRHERRVGQLGDGGKWVCDPHLIGRTKPCLVYSVGSNGEPSFEAAIKKEIDSNCEIHTFDMGDYKEIVEATGAHYHQWGIADKTEGVFKTLQDTVKELGHEGRTIDIFKIDCEGCEWQSYESLLTANVELRQVLIELHSNLLAHMPNPQTVDFFQTMYQHGYVIHHKEVNIRNWIAARKCAEFAFLKLHPDFFKGIDMAAF